MNCPTHLADQLLVLITVYWGSVDPPGVPVVPKLKSTRSSTRVKAGVPVKVELLKYEPVMPAPMNPPPAFRRTRLSSDSIEPRTAICPRFSLRRASLGFTAIPGCFADCFCFEARFKIYLPLHPEWAETPSLQSSIDGKCGEKKAAMECRRIYNRA
jgi:hypothetical protein